MIFFVARRIIASALAFFLRLFYCSQELLKLCIFDKFVPIQNLSRKFLDAGLWLVNCINDFVKVNFRKARKLELFPWKFLRMPTRKQCIQEIMYYVARQDPPNCKLITLFMVGNTCLFKNKMAERYKLHVQTTKEAGFLNTSFKMLCFYLNLIPRHVSMTF